MLRSHKSRRVKQCHESRIYSIRYRFTRPFLDIRLVAIYIEIMMLIDAELVAAQRHRRSLKRILPECASALRSEIKHNECQYHFYMVSVMEIWSSTFFHLRYNNAQAQFMSPPHLFYKQSRVAFRYHASRHMSRCNICRAGKEDEAV